ncbi:hypothetical protein [Streptomyces sp. NRRL S-350]|nr:hypothetical protein [Streptomyces sp. NRRL S-350]
MDRTEDLRQSATPMASATGSVIHQCLRGRPAWSFCSVEAMAGEL